MDANVSVERFAATISVVRGYFLRSLSASAVWDLMRVNSGALRLSSALYPLGLCCEPRFDSSNIENHYVPVSGLIDQVLDSFRTEQLAKLFSGGMH